MQIVCFFRTNIATNGTFTSNIKRPYKYLIVDYKSSSFKS